MPIDVDLSNWNKENAWPRLVPLFPDTEASIGAMMADTEEAEQNFAPQLDQKTKEEEENQENGKNTLSAWNGWKRMRVDGEELISPKTEDYFLDDFYLWWSKEENGGKNDDDDEFMDKGISDAQPKQQQHSQQLSTDRLQSTSTAASSLKTKKTDRQKKQNRGGQQGRRVVLGELFNYALSPLLKQCAPPMEGKEGGTTDENEEKEKGRIGGAWARQVDDNILPAI